MDFQNETLNTSGQNSDPNRERPWQYFYSNIVLNSTIAIFLIICAMPLFLIISLLIKLRDNGPLLFKGIRLGLNKSPFVMYKFRTLPVGAQKVIGPDPLVDKHPMVTPFAKFLRDTRIDEFPQLFNILFGNMVFVGPRPLRQEMYEKHCSHIKGYDIRFTKKPGLIGYSQLFTPHSSPQRIRSLIDNKFIRENKNYLWDLCLILFTSVVFFKLLFHKGALFLWKHLIKTKILRRYTPKRSLALNRKKVKNVKAYILTKIKGKEIVVAEGSILDIDENAFLLSSKEKIKPAEHVLLLEKERRKGLKKIKIRCKCTGEIYREFQKGGGDANLLYSVINYMPISQLDFFKFETYFLNKSMA